jgi:hypothetical protein
VLFEAVLSLRCASPISPPRPPSLRPRYK